MDGDCVFAVPGGTATANVAGTLLPAIHSLTFFQEGEINFNFSTTVLKAVVTIHATSLVDILNL
eukprot:SAG11_NODE_10353_length_837_cov_1.752033_1_plen_63_part_10